jgi:hypothetical protein
MTEIPRVTGEALTDKTSPGSLNITQDGTDASSRFFVAGADDMRYGYFMELPRIVIPSTMADNQSYAQSDVGVSFEQEDHHRIVSEGPRVGVANRHDAGLMERQMDLADLMRRKQYLTDFVWSQVDTVNELIWQAVVPWGLVLDGSVTSIPVDNMTFFRFKEVIVHVKIQSQPFQLGTLVLYFVPMRDSGYVSKHISTSRTNISILPHVMVQAGTMGEYAFRIPWVSTQPIFDTSLDVNNGLVRLQVFNPLLVGAGATQTVANGTIWVEFVEPEYSVIRPRALTLSNDFVSVDDDKEDNQSYAQGNVVGMLGTASNIISTVQETVTFAKKVKGRFVGGKDLDRPFVATNPFPVMQFGGPSLSELGMVDQGRHMGDIPSMDSLPTSEQFCSPHDELTVKNFVCRFSFYETVLFSTLVEAGTQLDLISMSCVPEFYAATLDSPIQLTSCGAGSLPFTYYQFEAFVLRVQVVSCIGQGGQIAIVPTYGGDNSVPFDASLSSYAHVIDISTSKNYEIEIPWHATRAWLRVPHKSYSGFEESSMYATGSVQIYALSSLMASESVPNTCYINLSFCLKGPKFRVVNNGLTKLVFSNPYTGVEGAVARLEGPYRPPEDKPRRRARGATTGRGRFPANYR